MNQDLVTALAVHLIFTFGGPVISATPMEIAREVLAFVREQLLPTREGLARDCLNGAFPVLTTWEDATEVTRLHWERMADVLLRALATRLAVNP